MKVDVTVHLKDGSCRTYTAAWGVEVHADYGDLIINSGDDAPRLDAVARIVIEVRG